MGKAKATEIEVTPEQLAAIIDSVKTPGLMPTCQKDKLAIIGTAATMGDTPWTDKELEIWGVAQVTTFPAFKRADLFGKLVNMFADLDSRALKSSSYFKAIVSGDAMDAERKHRDPFYFRPFARLVYSANEIPQSNDKSFAYYRRWCIYNFLLS